MLFFKKRITNDIKKDALKGYVLGVIFNWKFFKHTKFSNETFKEGFMWASGIIDKTFDTIIVGVSSSFIRKGSINIYFGQSLTKENEVIMDMFEELLFGDLNNKKDRTSDIPNQIIDDMKLKLWSISSIFKGAINVEELAQMYQSMLRDL